LAPAKFAIVHLKESRGETSLEDQNSSAETTTIASEIAPSDKADRLPQTFAYFAAFVALGLSSASMGPTLPGLAANVQTDLKNISLLFTARSLGYLLVSLRGGKLYDKPRGNRVMAVALVIMAMLLAFVPMLPTLWLLFFAILLTGIAEGALDIGGNTLLVWIHGKRVAPFMNALHFFFGVGAFLSPIIVARILQVNPDIRAAYWVLALLMLPMAFWVLRLPSPAPQNASTEKVEARTNPRLVAFIALFFFLYLGAELGFANWIFTYMDTLKLSDETTARYVNSAFWAALTLGRLLAIPLAARFRPGVILCSNLLGSLLSIAVILLWQQSFVAVSAGAVGLGLSLAPIFPTTFSFAERRLTITGQVTGWFLVGASAGGMFLPWLIGQLFEKLGPQVMMLIILFDLLAASLVFVMLLLNSDRKELEKV
jgi:MFS transporter, FHS family, Na+ dependent glucose transporter 1